MGRKILKSIIKKRADIRDKCSIEIIIDNFLQNPVCRHGPTFLFIRGKQRFFACSAYRDKKDCNFFLLESVWNKNKKCPKFEELELDHDELYNKCKKLQLTKDKYRCYCHTCSLLFSSLKEKHENHTVISNLSFDLLKNPTKLLKPISNNKREAQYYFKLQTISTIMQIIINNKIRSLLCLGTPRIHEYVKDKFSKQLSSLLLDIDYRLYNFFDPNEFCHYNFFNNHFFNEKCKTAYSIFLQNQSNVCIILDPPFGGRIEPLAKTLNDISEEHRKIHKNNSKVFIILILPYFMEPYIKNHISELKMTDYQVLYENHHMFNDFNKHGSPVRIYTNIPLKKVILPIEEGYKYCKKCCQWIGKWNKHCLICNKCTSKNGTTYIHCNDCNKCVKSTWKHCNICRKCSLVKHDCGTISFTQRCFKCNEYGHKINECKKEENKISHL